LKLAASLILLLGLSPLGAGAQVIQAVRRVPSQLSAFFVTGPRGGWGVHLSSPSALAVGPSGNVYIFDSGNSRVVKVSPAGEYLLDFGGPDAKGGARIHSGGLNDAIAVDRHENVYVTSASAGPRIMKFDSGGKFLHSFRVPSTVNTVAVNSRGEILVALVATQPLPLVHVFTNEGKYIRAFGERLVKARGKIPQEVNQVKLAVDAQDNVFAAFRSWPLVRKYSGDGKLVAESTYPVPENLMRPEARGNYSLDFFSRNPDASFTLPLLVHAISVNRERGCYVLLNGSGVVKVDERGNVLKQNVFLAPQGNNVTFVNLSVDARANRVLLLEFGSGVYSMPLVKNRAVL
jgi:NHL repeat